MKGLIVRVSLILLVLCVPSFAGVLAGSGMAVRDLSKGAYADMKFAARSGSYPVRHPMKAARGLGKGVKATAKVLAKV
jgi:hypothetical protein